MCLTVLPINSDIPFAIQVRCISNHCNDLFLLLFDSFCFQKNYFFFEGGGRLYAIVCFPLDHSTF